MTSYRDINKHEYHVQTSKSDEFDNGYGFVHTDRSLQSFPEFDLIVPIFLKKTYDYYEYVDIKKPSEILYIDRQNINPQFIELGFFDSVSSVSIRYGYQLNQAGIDYIRQRRNDISFYSDNEVRTWYESTGYFELPWVSNNQETTLSDLEKINIAVDSIVGKAGILGITINK